MKCILVPNPNEPYNLIQFSLAYDGRDSDGTIAPFGIHETEQAMIDHAIARNIEVGFITGDYYVVDEMDLPDPDLYDAWIWDDGVKIDHAKARRLGLT